MLLDFGVNRKSTRPKYSLPFPHATQPTQRMSFLLVRLSEPARIAGRCAAASKLEVLYGKKFPREIMPS